MVYSIIIQLLNSLRWMTGMCFLLLGVLGVILPLVPGLPFFVPAVVLLGRRDRALRFVHLLGRRILRRLRRSRVPLLRYVGMRISIEYVRVRRLVFPAILAAERAVKFA
jgi:hypothetical protein